MQLKLYLGVCALRCSVCLSEVLCCNRLHYSLQGAQLGLHILELRGTLRLWYNSYNCRVFFLRRRTTANVCLITSQPASSSAQASRKYGAAPRQVSPTRAPNLSITTTVFRVTCHCNITFLEAPRLTSAIQIVLLAHAAPQFTCPCT